eukprot:scaffold37572_cov176-Amphora_coffeaeformis.AAC.3
MNVDRAPIMDACAMHNDDTHITYHGTRPTKHSLAKKNSFTLRYYVSSFSAMRFAGPLLLRAVGPAGSAQIEVKQINHPLNAFKRLTF